MSFNFFLIVTLIPILSANPNDIPHTKTTQECNFIVSGSEDNLVRIFDSRSDTLLHKLKGHTDWVKSVSLSPDCKTLVSASLDGTIKWWHVSTG